MERRRQSCVDCHDATSIAMHCITYLEHKCLSGYEDRCWGAKMAHEGKRWQLIVSAQSISLILDSKQSCCWSGLLPKAWRATQRKYICEACEYKALAMWQHDSVRTLQELCGSQSFDLPKHCI